MGIAEIILLVFAVFGIIVLGFGALVLHLNKKGFFQ